jgi:hypothetical protein
MSKTTNDFESAFSASGLFEYASKSAKYSVSCFGVEHRRSWLALGQSEFKMIRQEEMRQIILRLYDREDRGQRLRMRRILKAMKETVNVD